MGAADRDRQRVHSGGRHECRGFIGVSAYAGGVGSVFAADLAQFGLQEQAVPVRPLRGGLGRGHVGVVVQLRGVEHDRRRPGLGAGVQQVAVLDMVEVHRDVDGGPLGDRGGGCGNRQQAPVVELHRVLADLQDHRPTNLFGPGDDGFGVLEGDHVERHQAGARTMRGGHEIGGSGDRHLCPIQSLGGGRS